MKKIATIIMMVCLAYGAKAQTFSTTGWFRIFDLQTDTVLINVSGLPSAIDTNFGVAHICMNITHTYDADLTIKLVSPDGFSVTLIQSTGGSGDNFTGTCVGEDGTAFTNASAPFGGLFLPVGNSSSFNNGQNPNGTWLFIVSDVANADTGSIHSASIEFVNNPPHTRGQASGGPTGIYYCPTCVCPGGAASCDLLPDMTSSAREIALNHNETPGFLYISNATPNIGYGPMDIYGVDSCFCGTTYVPCGTICPNGDQIKQAVKQRIYHKVAGNDTLTYYDRVAGTMTYHPTHGHLHVDGWANYTLRTRTSNPDATTWPIIGTGVKQSFCLINLGTCSGTPGECLDNNGNNVLTVPNNNLGFHTGCQLTQGIYPGNYDVYSISLNDPIPLNGVCNGDYYIVSITDPNNNFLESDETNNWVAVPITLTQQNPAPTITPSGSTTLCQGGGVDLRASTASNYLWSTGATTQTITVSASGTYTVSTTCGTSLSTSAPVTVSVTPVNVTVNRTPSSITCNGDPVTLTSSASSTGIQYSPSTFSSNLQVMIPDNNSTGVTSPIVVSGISPAALNSGSVVSVKINITHTYDADLAIQLISPSGNSIYLSNLHGGGGDNFTNTIFSMSAATLISAGAAPFTGTYKPDGNFSTLTGNANGTWLLKVQDLAGQDTGRILDWTLIINSQAPETFNYSWTSVPAGFTSSLQNPPPANPFVSTTYQVSVTSNASGCTGTGTVAVSVPPAISVNDFFPLNGLPGVEIAIIGNGFNNVADVTIAGISASSFTVISPTLIRAIVPNIATSTGVVCVKNSSNCIACSNGSFTILPSVTLNLKAYIEGYYAGNGNMIPVADPAGHANLCDTIVVELHYSYSPYDIFSSVTGTIDIHGNGNFIFPGAAKNNDYFIVVRHHNSIETWSKSAIKFSDVVNFDFSN